jgi:NADH-quinone oxidoreductase subunit L
MITILVFLPLLTALVAGLGGRVIGHTAAKALTTGGLFVSAALACACSCK